MFAFLVISTLSNRLPVATEADSKRFEIHITVLQQELAEVTQQTHAFEAILRNRRPDLIVEADELHFLYKAKEIQLTPLNAGNKQRRMLD